MAICNYSIHVKGNRQAVFMFCAILPREGQLAIDMERQAKTDFIMHLSGTCRDEQALYGAETKVSSIDANQLTEEQIRSGSQLPQFFQLSLRQKSELLKLDIQVRAWSDEPNYDQFSHYRYGFTASMMFDSYKKGGNGYEFDF